MDRIDCRILGLLERDGRLSFAELGERVGLSKTPCWKRVQALERDGVILGYRAVLDPAKLGLDVLAFVRVTVSFDAHEAFESAVNRHPRIMAAYATLGDADYLLHVVTLGIGDLDTLLRQELWRLPGVLRFTTQIGTRTVKSGGALVEDDNRRPAR